MYYVRWVCGQFVYRRTGARSVPRLGWGNDLYRKGRSLAMSSVSELCLQCIKNVQDENVLPLHVLSASQFQVLTDSLGSGCPESALILDALTELATRKCYEVFVRTSAPERLVAATFGSTAVTGNRELWEKSLFLFSQLSVDSEFAAAFVRLNCLTALLSGDLSGASSTDIQYRCIILSSICAVQPGIISGENCLPIDVLVAFIKGCYFRVMSPEVWNAVIDDSQQVEMDVSLDEGRSQILAYVDLIRPVLFKHDHFSNEKIGDLMNMFAVVYSDGGLLVESDAEDSSSDDDGEESAGDVPMQG